MKVISLPFIQNESKKKFSKHIVLAMGVSEQFLIVSNKKNEIYRWTYDNESVRQAYNIPMADKVKGVFTRFFCEPKGYHTIFRHNTSVYYFHIKSQKIKELFKLKEILVESIGWDEHNGEHSTNVRFWVILANIDWLGERECLLLSNRL
jgi:hypothetical protein